MRIGLAGHQLGLFVDVTEPMQHRGHAALGVGHAEALLHPVRDRLGGLIEMVLQVSIEQLQLRRGERAGTAPVGHLAKGLDTTLLVAPVMVAHRIGVDLQHLGDVLRAPPRRQQHHRLDPIGLTLAARQAMSAPQFLKLVGWQGVVVHAENDTSLIGWLH